MKRAAMKHPEYDQAMTKAFLSLEGMPQSPNITVLEIIRHMQAKHAHVKQRGVSQEIEGKLGI